MRVCPKCGFEDHPMWRPRRSRVFCEYVKAETLFWNDPDLFNLIEKDHPEPFFDGHFVYHITRSGLNVERIEKSLYEIMKWGAEPQEKVDHSFLSLIKPLTEFSTKGDNCNELA